MTIKFSEIPDNIRVPRSYGEYNTKNAILGVAYQAPKIAVIAQKLASGTGVAETPVNIASTNDGTIYGGPGSIAELTLNALFLANYNIDVDLIPLDDAGAGTAATGTITVATTATSNGTLRLWIGSKLIPVGVTLGDTPDEIATAINVAIGAVAHLLPVTAGVSGSVVTLTFKHKGTLGNNVACSYENVGIGATTFTIVQIGTTIAGATDPDITNALTAIFASDYDYIICTLNDAGNLGLLKTHLQEISTPVENRKTIGVYGWNKAQATVETLAGTTMNYQRLTVGTVTYDKTTGQGHTPDFQIAGAYCGAVSRVLDPAKPRNGQVLTGVVPPSLPQRYSWSNMNNMLYNGVSPLDVNSKGEVYIVRAITNYTTDAASNPDASMLDLTTILSLDFGSDFVETEIEQNFEAAKKTDRTKNALKSQIQDSMRKLGKAEIWHKIDEYAPLVAVEDVDGDPTAQACEIPAPVVPGLHVIKDKFNLLLR